MCAQVTQHKGLGTGGKMLQRLIEMRAPFLDPINILQVRKLLLQTLDVPFLGPMNILRLSAVTGRGTVHGL